MISINYRTFDNKLIFQCLAFYPLNLADERWNCRRGLLFIKRAWLIRGVLVSSHVGAGHTIHEMNEEGKERDYGAELSNYL